MSLLLLFNGQGEPIPVTEPAVTATASDAAYGVAVATDAAYLGASGSDSEV